MAYLATENMCLHCSSGPRSTAKLAIESIEPSVKNRQNFCGLRSTSGRNSPARTNISPLSRSSDINGRQRCRVVNV